MICPSADMLGSTYQSPPPVCNFDVVSSRVSMRLNGGYPTNKAAPGSRGRLSIFAPTDVTHQGRVSATSVTATTIHLFIITSGILFCADDQELWLWVPVIGPSQIAG